jgi:hypothetical protein
MAQRELWGQGGTTHGMVEVGVAKSCSTAALHGGGVGGQHGQAKTEPEAGLDLSALELQSSREREGDQPSRSPTAGAAKKAGAGALAPVCAGVVEVHQGIGTDLGRTPRNCALRGCDGAQAVGTGLTGISPPQISHAIM